MKKIFIGIISICLACMLALSGCSCAPETQLSFNNNFAGFEDVEQGKIYSPSSFSSKIINYVENLTYDVTFEPSDNLSENAMKNMPKYSSGTYISKLEKGKSLPEGIESDIVGAENFKDENLYYLCSELNLDVSVPDENGGEKILHDKILSEVYFYPASLSFAPVYSVSTVKSTFVSINGENLEFNHLIYQYVTTYNLDSYRMTKSLFVPESPEDASFYQILDIMNNVDINLYPFKPTDSQSGNKGSFMPLAQSPDKIYEYSARLAIDNNIFMFAIRNFDLALEQSTSIPTISYAYGEQKPIAIKNESEETFNIANDLFGAEIKEIKVNKLSFSVSDSNYPGSKKFAKIQKKVAGDANYHSLIVEYVEPVIDLSMTTYGQLKYTLKSVDIVK